MRLFTIGLLWAMALTSVASMARADTESTIKIDPDGSLHIQIYDFDTSVFSEEHWTKVGKGEYSKDYRYNYSGKDAGYEFPDSVETLRITP